MPSVPLRAVPLAVVEGALARGGVSAALLELERGAASKQSSSPLRTWLTERAGLDASILEKTLAILKSEEVFCFDDLKMLRSLPRFAVCLTAVTAAKIAAAIDAESEVAADTGAADDMVPDWLTEAAAALDVTDGGADANAAQPMEGARVAPARSGSFQRRRSRRSASFKTGRERKEADQRMAAAGAADDETACTISATSTREGAAPPAKEASAAALEVARAPAGDVPVPASGNTRRSASFRSRRSRTGKHDAAHFSEAALAAVARAAHGGSQAAPPPEPIEALPPARAGGRDRSGDLCFRCNERGHWARDCPTRPQKKLQPPQPSEFREGQQRGGEADDFLATVPMRRKRSSSFATRRERRSAVV